MPTARACFKVKLNLSFLDDAAVLSLHQSQYLHRTSQARVTPAPISGKKRKTDHRSGGGRGYRKIPQTEEDFELEASREEEKA